jgi:hypothetical protein
VITPARALGLTLRYPNVGVSVVAVNGELDTLTGPLLGTFMRQLIATTPAANPCHASAALPRCQRAHLPAVPQGKRNAYYAEDAAVKVGRLF